MEEPRLTSSGLLVRTEQNSLVEEFLRAAFHSGLQAPAQGIAQIADKMLGTDLVKSIPGQGQSTEAEFLSARWHAQQFGAAAGMAVPFLIIHKGVGKLSTSLLGKLDSTATTQLLTRRVVGESAATGALFDGLMKPVTPAQEPRFWETRLGNSVIGGTTFAVLARTSAGIKSIMKAERGIGAALIRSDIGSSMISGIPAGLVNVELAARFHEGHGASTRELVQGAYSFSIIGGGIAAGKRVLGGNNVEHSLQHQLPTQSEKARHEGQASLGEKAANAWMNLQSRVVQGWNLHQLRLLTTDAAVTNLQPKQMNENSTSTEIVSPPSEVLADLSVVAMISKGSTEVADMVRTLRAASKRHESDGRERANTRNQPKPLKRIWQLNADTTVDLIAKHIEPSGKFADPPASTKIEIPFGGHFELGDGHTTRTSDRSVTTWNGHDHTVTMTKYLDGTLVFEHTHITTGRVFSAVTVKITRNTDGTWHTSSTSGTSPSRWHTDCFTSIFTPDSIEQFFQLVPHGHIHSASSLRPILSSRSLCAMLYRLDPYAVSRAQTGVNFDNLNLWELFSRDKPISVVLRPSPFCRPGHILREPLMDFLQEGDLGPEPQLMEPLPGMGLKVVWAEQTKQRSLIQILQDSEAGLAQVKRFGFGVTSWTRTRSETK